MTRDFKLNGNRLGMSIRGQDGFGNFSRLGLLQLGNPGLILSIGSISPITPVEATPIKFWLTPSFLAISACSFKASSLPWGPVQELAIALLTMIPCS